MKEALALIDKIIDEHKIIRQGTRALEQAVNDAEAISDLESARDAFMPGRHEQKKGLQKLRQTLETLEKGVKAHFEREETGLLSVFEEHGDEELVSALRSVLLEHEDLRNRIAHTRSHVTELTEGGLSSHLWEASAHDMRAHITHTRKLLEAHAGIEQELLVKLRHQLQGKK